MLNQIIRSPEPSVQTSSHQSYAHWIIGIFGSWFCVWLAGPWLLNSILVRVENPELRAISFREGDTIRWRTEGLATTLIGPQGLPGWLPNGSTNKIVLWGDSQVEGVCVNDQDKIANQIIRESLHSYVKKIDCLPMGRSGTNSSDWREWMPAADELLHPILHCWIVTDLSDLLAIASPSVDSASDDRWHAPSPAVVLWAKRFHGEAFFQSTRNLLFDPQTGRVRTLRWSLGPVTRQGVPASSFTAADVTTAISIRTCEQLEIIHRQFDDRFVILYAPGVPRIAERLRVDHPDDAAWDDLATRMHSKKIPVIDMRASFTARWNREQRLSRGFHNGTPGVGHLNALGNEWISKAIVEFAFGSADSDAINAPPSDRAVVRDNPANSRLATARP